MDIQSIFSSEHSGLPMWLSDIGCYLCVLEFVLAVLASDLLIKREKHKKFQLVAITGMILSGCFIASVILDYMEPRMFELKWYISKFCLFSGIFIFFLICFLKGIFQKKKYE